MLSSVIKDILSVVKWGGGGVEWGSEVTSRAVTHHSGEGHLDLEIEACEAGPRPVHPVQVPGQSSIRCPDYTLVLKSA